MNGMRRKTIRKTRYYNKLKYSNNKYRTRRTNISRNNVKDIVSYQCEAYDYILVPSGNTLCLFGSTNSYWNFRSVLSSSATFANFVGLYTMYKITGCSVRVSRNVSDNDVNLALGGFLPSPVVSISPTIVNTSNGNLPVFNDTKYTIDANSTQPQSKYWAFPDEFSADGIGLGIWNAMASYASQMGQLDVSQMMGLPVASTATVACYSVRLTLYVKFKDLKR